MKYEEALDTVKSYQYLLGKEITEKSTGIKSRVDYITIIPTEGIKVINNDWLHPLKEVFGKYLSDKDCRVNFVVDFTKATSSGLYITLDRIKKDYVLPESSES